jgi:aspartate kinase
MDERNLSDLLGAFSEAHIKLNMMQLSALSLSVCIDQNSLKLKKLTDLFESKFLFSIKNGLELLTIINFKQEELKKLCVDRIILMEQFSSKIAQLVMI